MPKQVFHLAFSFLEQEPAAAARLLEEQDSGDVVNFLANTPANLVLPLFREMLPAYTSRLFVSAPTDSAIGWMEELDNHVLCAILRYLDEKERGNLLELISSKKRSACKTLLNYRSDMIGAWVETDIPTFPAEMRVDDAERRLRRRHYKEDRLILIVNNQRQVQGQVSVATLLRAARSMTVGSLITAPTAQLNGRSLVSAVVHHTLWQQQDFAPVINRQREIIGVIWHSRVRRLLTSRSGLTERRSGPPATLLMDLALAHGESMRGMLDALRKGNSH